MQNARSVVVVVVVLFLIFTSCAPRYLPVHHYHETERVKVERDSIHYTDTVRVAARGDTIFLEVVKWRTRYKTVTDTIVKVDTVQLPPRLISPAPAKHLVGKWLWWIIVSALFIALAGGAAYAFKHLLLSRKK